MEDLCFDCKIFFYCKGNPKCDSIDKRNYVLSKFEENKDAVVTKINNEFNDAHK